MENPLLEGGFPLQKTNNAESGHQLWCHHEQIYRQSETFADKRLVDKTLNIHKVFIRGNYLRCPFITYIYSLYWYKGYFHQWFCTWNLNPKEKCFAVIQILVIYLCHTLLSTLVQVMAWCPNHYLKQCWLIILYEPWQLCHDMTWGNVAVLLKQNYIMEFLLQHGESSSKYSQYMPHSLPLRKRDGISFASTLFDLQSIMSLPYKKLYPFQICADMPEWCWNWPDGACVRPISAQFWHTMACLQVRSCYEGESLYFHWI